MKTVFIGSVFSSKVALETLIEAGVTVDLVCSLDESASKNVSDYYPIHEIADKNSIPFIKFTKVNSDNVINRIKEIEPHFIFVIGLSQIISTEIINLALNYSIGFHPTPLPKYRGRAALPWMIILGVRKSKISLFKLDQGMDSGDIITQYPYEICESDYVMDVYSKVCEAMKKALIASIPKIYNNSVDFIKQNEMDATYLLIRRPEDGKINWSESGKEIETLIRAANKPYPGAFTYYKNSKIIIWRARIIINDKYIGIPGQVAWINEQGYIGVVANEGMLVIEEYSVEGENINILPGHKFK